VTQPANRQQHLLSNEARLQGRAVNSGYHSRLGLMEDWYGDFLRAENREEVLLRDFEPHAAYLGMLRGQVIDIGGGAGLPARFMKADVAYVVVDPSKIWSSPEWFELGERFRQLGPKPNFVDAPGEQLPFPDGDFDAALSLWTLNHVRDPAACLREMARVMKRGASARLVLEDVEPSWMDLLGDGFQRVGRRLSGRHGQAGIHLHPLSAAAAKIRRTWPLQEDHLRISDRDLRRWLRPHFRIRRRSWLGGCLTYDLEKP
jgi:SAM-dependent methyltransferase